MRNTNQQNETFLIVVLTIGLVLGFLALGRQLHQAKVSNIEKTVSQQFEDGE